MEGCRTEPQHCRFQPSEQDFSRMHTEDVSWSHRSLCTRQPCPRDTGAPVSTFVWQCYCCWAFPAFLLLLNGQRILSHMYCFLFVFVSYFECALKSLVVKYLLTTPLFCDLFSAMMLQHATVPPIARPPEAMPLQGFALSFLLLPLIGFKLYVFLMFLFIYILSLVVWRSIDR